MLEIELNGKKLEVPEGSTIMDAAHREGIFIPHFCYHRKLSIAANCRICLVQVEKAPKPLPACATPVTNGLKVWTHSDAAFDAQKGVMEFLLIFCRLRSSTVRVCIQGFGYEFQKIGKESLIGFDMFALWQPQVTWIKNAPNTACTRQRVRVAVYNQIQPPEHFSALRHGPRPTRCG